MLATPNTTANDPELAQLLKTMSGFAAKPLASFDPTWHFEQGGIVDDAPAPLSAKPAGMAEIPGGKYRFVAQGTEIEGAGNAYNDIGRGVDVQFGWEPRANRFHSQYVNLKPYYIDIAPVTQGEFYTYLQKTGAKALPADRYHYLRNWDWSDAMPKPGPGNDSLPV
eukprot:COSAG01_NODE_38017_length_495_cov_2.010101_1_plen_165_part_11